MFQLKFIFRILRSWNARFSHRSISLYDLCTKKCLEVNYHVSNWNKAKNIIFVRSILQISQLEITVFIYKLMCLSSLWISVSYGFYEFNRVASWNKDKTIILLRSLFQICQLEIMISYSMLTYVKCNHVFPKSNFEGNFSIYVL